MQWLAMRGSCFDQCGRAAIVRSMDAVHAACGQNLRAIRNSFAHDYPEDDALKAAYLNQAVEAVPVLLQLLDLVKPLADTAKKQLDVEPT